VETIVYFSRNGKKPPFEVKVEIDGQVVYINCNCELGIEKKICRHKINAIRGDKESKHLSTSDEIISRLRVLFGITSTLRQHLEEKWRLLREFASDNPDEELEICNKRKLLGEAFAKGFINENSTRIQEPFDADEWEEFREIYTNGLKCLVTLNYVNHEGVATNRDVIVEEIFISDFKFYLLGHCNLRKQKRTFRVDRIQSIVFGQECSQIDKTTLLNVVFQGRPHKAN
jgi:WYL domain